MKSEFDDKVNIGYGSVDKKNLTTPVSKMNVEQSNYGSYRDIYDLIQGKFAGVEVKGKSIRIQGANSFMASTEPLFVVDGIVVESIDNIRPVEVKSIEVLKGASAAVYGSRGGNGVILITLKGSGNR